MWSAQEKSDRHVGAGTHSTQARVASKLKAELTNKKLTAELTNTSNKQHSSTTTQLFGLCVPLSCSACGPCRNSITAPSTAQHGTLCPPVPRHLRELEQCPASLLCIHSSPDLGIDPVLFSEAGTAHSSKAGRHDRRSAGVCCLPTSTHHDVSMRTVTCVSCYDIRSWPACVC